MFLLQASKQFVDQTEEEVLSQVSEVIMGQVYTAGGGQNPARQAAKAAGRFSLICLPWQ